jgi:hypothetical protein
MLRCILYFLVTMAFAAPALGQSVGPRHKITEIKDPLVNALSLDTPRVFSVPDNLAEGYAILVLDIEFTRVAATRVDITCSGARRKSRGSAVVKLFVLQACTVASGVCTLDDAIGQKDVSGGSKNWPIRFDMLGHSNITCTLSSVSGGASDIASVLGALVAE